MTDSATGIADTRGHYRRQRSLYADDLTHFLARTPESILGLLAGATGFPVTLEQRFAWTEQMALLGDALGKTNPAVRKLTPSSARYVSRDAPVRPARSAAGRGVASEHMAA